MTVKAIEKLTTRKKRAIKLQEKIKKDYEKARNEGKKELNAKKITAEKNQVSLVWVYKCLKSE